MWIPGYRDNLEPTFWDGTACPQNPTVRYLGAEIEVANGTTVEHAKNLDKVITKWHALVHGDCAFEVCTAPAGGHLWVDQITELCTIFHAAKISASGYDCGCHVHVDARDLCVFAIERLVRLLVHIEPILFMMVPAARRGNTYCAPTTFLLQSWLARLSPTTPRKEWLLECIYGRNEKGIIRYHDEAAMRELKKNKTKHCGIIPRFHAFNFQPYYGHGTIECRLLNGCTNATRLINWGVLLAAIFDYAKNSCKDDIARIVTHSRLRTVLVLSPSPAHRRWIVQTIRTHNPRVQLSKEIAKVCG